MHQLSKAAVAWPLLVLCLSSYVMAEEMPGVKVEKIVSSSHAWDGTAYASYPAGTPELSVVRYSIPANTSLPWHSHAVPNVAYVMTGEITVEKQTGEHRLFKAGEAITEVVNSTHRGYTGAVPAELVVFYAGGQGLPLVTRQDQAK